MVPDAPPVTTPRGVRLVVGDDPGPRSGVWRVWSNGDDTYLAARSIAGLMKVSLHKSDVHRVAFTKSGQQQLSIPGDRLINRWSRPADFANGAARLFNVFIPTDDLTTPLVEPPLAEKQKIVMLNPAPGPNGLTVLSVFRTEPEVTLRPEDGMASALNGYWPLRSGGTVWVATTQEAYRPEHRAVANDVRKQAAAICQQRGIDFTGAEHARLTAILNPDSEGVPGMIDLSPQRTPASTAPHTA